MVVHEAIMLVGKLEAEHIERILTKEPTGPEDCFGEDHTLTNTLVFPNGAEIDLKICGVSYREGESNLPWTEAVLFVDGAEVVCSEPSDEFFGEWHLEYDEDEYIITVEKSSAKHGIRVI